jgi:hypothetical protein
MRAMAFVQGCYFLLTGVWPLVHLRSFLAVTGPKTDLWLVKTVGVLVTAIAAALLAAAAADGAGGAPAVLGMGSALALGAVDVWYVRAGVISRIYLLDAGAEALLVAGWLFAAAAR